jgi:penicillin-binding protein 2
LHGQQGTIAWFICFAPIENPRIAVAVAVESLQQGELYGGAISAPMVRNILQEYFKDYPDALAPKAFDATVK